MYIVAIAWIFVVVLMSLAEATSTEGSILGALITLTLYGALPLSLVLYLMGTPARRRARQRAALDEAATAPTQADPSAADPDRRGVPAGDPVAPKREEA
jgi:NADH:ubiquinone oxidoreductase subunit 6 (subunit J)